MTTGSGKWWRFGGRSITGALAEGICAIEDRASFGENIALERKRRITTNRQWSFRKTAVCERARPLLIELHRGGLIMHLKAPRSARARGYRWRASALLRP